MVLMFGFLLCFAAGNDLGRERRHHFFGANVY